MLLRILLILILSFNCISLTGQHISVANVEDINGLFYTVQIGTLKTSKVPEAFKKVSDINIEYLENKSFRFSSGVFRELKQARFRKDQIIETGIKGAFIIAYYEGKRISLREVRNLKLYYPDEANYSSDSVKKTTKSNNEFNEIHQEAFKEVLDIIENEIIDYSDQQVPIDTSSVHQLFSLRFDSVEQYEIDSLYNQALVHQLKADPGLQLNAWYLHNFEPGFFENEDLTYLDRLNITLNWNVLKGGLYDNHLKSKRLMNQIEISKLQQHEIKSIDSYENLYNYIIYTFNKEKIKTVEERIKLLNRQIQIHEALYSSKEKTWEEILELKSNISRAMNMHKKWSSYNHILESSILKNNPLLSTTNAAELPLMDIVSDSLFRKSSNSSEYFSKLIELESNNIDLQYNRWKDWYLRPFARYNFIGQNTPFDRNYASVGLNLTMPLKFKGYSEIKDVKKLMIEQQHDQKETNDDHELLNYYYEYQYKLEQVINFYYKKFKIEERLRKEIIKYQFNDINFHPLTAINYMDELIAVKLELLDLKQQLYLKLLKINEYKNETTPLKYTYTINPDEFSFKYNQKRHIYIWSKFFNKQDNLFLIHYLKVNEIKTVMLSIGKNPNFEKLTNFSELANKYNIEIHGLIGKNSLAVQLDSNALNQYYTHFSNLNFTGVHFDVEPQTFPDWEIDKLKYTNNLLNSISYFKELSAEKEFKTNASISMYYPEETFTTFYDICDNIYIMAYETPDIQFIKSKTSEEFSILKEKAILSIRTKDFKNRLYFEKFTSQITEDMNLQQIAIHDLGTLFDLDNNSSIEK